MTTLLDVAIIATTRSEIADFLRALLTVYVILLIAYIVVNLILQFARPGYYRWLDAVLTFLREVSEPYLAIFRRFIPPLGPLDLSPIVAIFVLQIVGRIVVGIIDG